MTEKVGATGKKCGTCRFYGCAKKMKKSFLLNVLEVETDYNSNCLCKKSGRFNKSTNIFSSCPYWERDSIVESAILNEKQEEENERIERRQQLEIKKAEDERKQKERIERQIRQEEYNRQKREQQKLKNEVELERLKLEEERKKLEYTIWYSKLTPEQQAAEDERKRLEEIEKQKREEERKKEEEKRKEQERIEALRREEEREKERIEQEKQRQIEEEQAKRIRKQNTITFLCILGFVALVIIGIIVGISIKKSIDRKRNEEAFNNSISGIFANYLSQKEGYNNGLYAEYVEIEGRGKVLLCIEFKRNGFTDNYERTCDFRVTTVLPPKEGENFSEIQSFFFFNLEGSDNEKSFGEIQKYGITQKCYPCFCARVKFNNSAAIVQYSQIKYNSSEDKLTNNGWGYNYENWDKKYNDYLYEGTENGWNACVASYIFANQLFKEATGRSLYE